MPLTRAPAVGRTMLHTHRSACMCRPTPTLAAGLAAGLVQQQAQHTPTGGLTDQTRRRRGRP